MASNFKDWGVSWGNSWGSVATDPNAAYGAASFTFTATGTLTGGTAPGDMVGAAAFSITATGTLLQPAKPAGSRRPAYSQWPHHYIPHRRPRKRRQEEIVFLGR